MLKQLGKNPRLVAVAGGSGSGKTTLVRKLEEQVGGDRVLVLHLDHYYRDLSHLSQSERDGRNFDHPSALDDELLIQHVRQLVVGHGIDRPIYDFASHTRRAECVRLEPKPVIIVDGIHSLYWPELRQLCSLKVFVDVDDDVRFIRRLSRDMRERGRTADGVIQQYLGSVKSMHDQYVSPKRDEADIIVSWMEFNERAVAMLAGMIETWVKPG